MYIVHWGRNLHIHYVRLGRNLYILYVRLRPTFRYAGNDVDHTFDQGKCINNVWSSGQWSLSWSWSLVFTCPAPLICHRSQPSLKAVANGIFTVVFKDTPIKERGDGPVFFPVEVSEAQIFGWTKKGLGAFVTFQTFGWKKLALIMDQL